MGNFTGGFAFSGRAIYVIAINAPWDSAASALVVLVFCFIHVSFVFCKAPSNNRVC